ncbi:MAG: tRNA uridine-5-carboxymethylaminomethyl(34) synthesis enzyme MnmG [Rhodobacterales bacterium]|nr:tRNA uridine-5-carboxymethylaminomethyl(34) synthesis enzyme MnmG [Rhodobacterales bacterium]
MKHYDFDVVVVGGGHAGCEAAAVAARIGARTCLITLSKSNIGVMSCNPAIGGLGKGHLVREIDALDGLMSLVADKAGIQFRLLNRRKGPAVQGPRAQADRAIYRQAMWDAVASCENLRILEAEVADLIMNGSVVTGVVLHDGSAISARSVILTTGTFLRGVIHIGFDTKPGGRVGEQPSVNLAKRMDSFGLNMGRLKTGTPPRLDGKTIDWARLDKQPGDEEPTFFSFMTTAVSMPQVECGIAHTNASTHAIIRKNLKLSSTYGGKVEGEGPRYCPSIEDKVVRFSEKDSHQIFLEPEGLATDIVYPNGISTSMPAEIQQEYVNSITGLHTARIVQPGYAIEYDYVDPRALDEGLELRDVPSLFLAGQINGTTGYEEAAAQGLVAGINAAMTALDREKVQFSRTTSYIGVMIDDLIMRGVTEPYRMFTSRAEFRLALRADNADQRLTQYGIDIGCVSELRRRSYLDKNSKLTSARSRLEHLKISPKSLKRVGLNVNIDGGKRTGMQILAYPDVTIKQFCEIDSSLAEIDPAILKQLAKEALYATYIKRQAGDVAIISRDAAHSIPKNFDFSCLKGLSNELKAKLGKVRPSNIGQAARMEGMTPAALTLILARVRRSEGRTGEDRIA